MFDNSYEIQKEFNQKQERFQEIENYIPLQENEIKDIFLQKFPKLKKEANKFAKYLKSVNSRF